MKGMAEIRLTSWGKGRVVDLPICFRVSKTSQVVVWDFWTIKTDINSITGLPMNDLSPIHFRKLSDLSATDGTYGSTFSPIIIEDIEDIEVDNHPKWKKQIFQIQIHFPLPWLWEDPGGSRLRSKKKIRPEIDPLTASEVWKFFPNLGSPLLGFVDLGYLPKTHSLGRMCCCFFHFLWRTTTYHFPCQSRLF